MDAQLREWAAQVDLLKSKAANAKADGKLQYAKEVDALRDKQRAAEEKLTEVKRASADAWEDLKHGVERSWDDLKGAVKSAADRLK